MDEIIQRVIDAYKLGNDKKEDIVNNDSWQSEIEEDTLSVIAEESDMSLEELITKVEEYRQENKEEIEEKDSTKKKKKINSGIIILAGGAILLVGIGFFLYKAGMNTINKKNPTFEINNTTKNNKTATNSNIFTKKDNLKFETITTSKSNEKNISNKVKKDEHKSLKTQCFTIKEYVGKKVVSYAVKKNGVSIKYIPSYTNSNWDKKGYKMPNKLIADDVDDINKMVNVGPNKWLPLGLFSKCSLLNN